MVRKFSAFIFLLLISAFICGCGSLTLSNGKYETSLPGREDFAAVYNDLIFIGLREPSDDPSQNNYWIWAGSFSIDDDGRIMLDMDKKLAKKWNFSYNLYRRNTSISVHDIGAGNSFDLRLRASDNPSVNRISAPAAPSAAPGTFPAYR